VQGVVEVTHARTVTIQLQPEHSLIRFHSVAATRAADSAWTFSIDTTLVPNGTYQLYAVVTNEYGTYDSQPTMFTVDTAFGPEVDDDQASSVDHIAILDGIVSTYESSNPQPQIASIFEQSPLEVANTVASTSPEQRTYGAIAQQSNMLLASFGIALRARVPEYIGFVRDRLTTFEQHTKDILGTLIVSPTINDGMQQTLHTQERFSAFLSHAVSHYESREQYIQGQASEAVLRDTDADGVVDVDEYRLGTDPESADSDGDGYTDFAEIVGGFNPLSVIRESISTHQEPTDAFPASNDVLEFLDFTATYRDNTGQYIPRITGRAPHRSFVTLSVYPEKIHITARTDHNGVWKRDIDAPLRDGQHELYAVQTDNTGAIIARTTPFHFFVEHGVYRVGRERAPFPAAALPGVDIRTHYLTILSVSLVVVLVGMLLIVLGTFINHHAVSLQKRAVRVLGM
jgi:hypothetical protein